ncbi:MAG: WD40 repeat domain-containing serine/threonine protein kinase [Pyrinomonadaceae bacterium]
MNGSSKDTPEKTLTELTIDASVTLPTISYPTLKREVAAEWQVGDSIFDTYEVIEIIGQGGMGVVYRVHHKEWNLDLAVKCPRREIFAKQSGQEAFKREAENWVKLGLHPHIVSCYYVRTLGGIPRVFAEYVAGPSLAEWIRSKRIYEGGDAESLRRILDCAIQFSWALHYSHEQGLIHQDVKPPNVLIAPGGMLKVTDFGLSKARELAGELSDSPGGPASYAGMTPAYCSPEQAQKLDLTLKTDIWSWAISVWEMFSGSPPCRYGQTAGEAFQEFSGAAANDSPIQLPPAISSLLQQCFSISPADRPKDMQAISDVLIQIYAEATGETYPRTQPKAADLLSDSLNNYAVSMLDMGLTKDANEKLAQALKTDPRHPEANFNSLLLSWRASEVTDFDVIERLGSFTAVASAKDRVTQLLQNCEAERGHWTELELLPGQNIVAIDPNGTRAVVRQDDGFAIVSIPSGEEVCRLEEKDMEYFSFARFDPNGKFLLLCDWERFCVWDTAIPERIRSVRLPPAYRKKLFEAPVIRSDGAVFYPVEGAITVCLPNETEFVSLCSVEHATIRSLCFERQDEKILAAYNDGTVRCWNAKTGRNEFVFQIGNSAVMSAAFAVDGSRFVACLGNGAAHLYQATQGGNRIVEFQPNPDYARIAAFDLSGRKLATWTDCFSDARPGIDSGMIRIWDLASRRCLRTFPGMKRDYGAGLAFGSHYLFAFNHDGAKAWQVPEQYKRAAFEIVRPKSSAAALSAESEFENATRKARSFIDAQRNREAFALLTENLREHPEFKFDQRALELLRVLHYRGKKTGIRDYWSLHEMKTDRQLPVSCVKFLDATAAITGSKAGSLQLWDLQTGFCSGNLRGHTDAIHTILVSPERIVTIDRRNNLRAWERSTLKCVAYFDCSKYKPLFLHPALSSDGRYVATTDEENLGLYMWDLDLEEVDSSRSLPAGTTPAGHIQGTGLSQSFCQLTPDRNEVTVTTGTGTTLAELKGHSANVVSCDLSIDERFVVSGDEAGCIRFWEIDWEVEL